MEAISFFIEFILLPVELSTNCQYSVHGELNAKGLSSHLGVATPLTYPSSYCQLPNSGRLKGNGVKELESLRKFWVSIILVLCLLASGCATERSSDDLFSYKGTKIGDNSKLGGIVRLLPGHDQFEGMELQTKNEPYELKLFYETVDGPFTDEMLMHIVTTFFTLVPNAGTVTVVIDGTPHRAERGVLENWYGRKLTEIQTEKELKELEAAHPANSGEMAMIFSS